MNLFPSGLTLKRQAELDFLNAHSRWSSIGLPRRKFLKGLFRRYGQEILGDFNKLHVNPFWTLTAMGKKYGVTREYIRQAFGKLYGIPYTTARVQKTEARKDNLVCVNDPRHKVADYKEGLVKKGAVGEFKTIKKCHELGFEAKPCREKEIDLVINGYKVDVKSAYTSCKPTGCVSTYYRFCVSKKQIQKCAFIVCWIAPKDLFYIFPIRMVRGPRANPKKTQCLHIRNEDQNHGNLYPDEGWYEVYREAWHLLSAPQPTTRKPTSSNGDGLSLQEATR